MAIEQLEDVPSFRLLDLIILLVIMMFTFTCAANHLVQLVSD